MIAMLSPVISAWKAYNSGARNMKVNSIGSVTPVRKAVSASDIKSPPTWARRPLSAVWYMASAAAGRPNIITGKKPAMKPPAAGSPAKKRLRSPVASPKLPNTNHTKLLSTWCRPVTISSRLSAP